MAAEWYYTTNKQQMGPVSWMDLRELADTGILKPHDLVWTEGMDEWVKAVQQRGLFADGGASGRTSSSRPPSGRRGRRRVDDEIEEEDEDDKRTSRKKAKKRAAERTKMATGVKVSLILGGVLCGLLFLGCAGALMIWLTVRGSSGPRQETYTIVNLQPGNQHTRSFNFQQGQLVSITVVNNLTNPLTDVDLFVHRGNAANNNPFVADIRLPFQDPNCRVTFGVPATGAYEIRVVNLGPGPANSCVVTVDVRAQN